MTIKANMFIRLSPAQATGIYGWGEYLKTTLSWKDCERHQPEFEKLMKLGVKAQDLFTIQRDKSKWVSVCKCKPHHAVHMHPWRANPFTDLHGDLADVIALKATGKQLQDMGVTFEQLVDNGMTPDTMRLMALSLQSWIDLGFTLDEMAAMTDAQLSRVFGMTRHALAACFRGEKLSDK